MKIYIVLLIGFSSFNLYSQEFSLNSKIFDSITNEPIPFCNLVLLNNRYGTATNKNGDFYLNFNNYRNDTIKITSLGYKNKYFSIDEIRKYNKDTIHLTPTSVELNEVIIDAKIIEYNKPEVLGLKKNENIKFTSSFGDEVAVYIDNPSKKQGKMKSVILFLKKTKNADYIADLNIKFYEYDSIKNLPGNELYEKNIIVSVQNKNKKIKIDIEDKNIKFPEKGVCIGVELINNSSKILKKYYKVGPSIAYTREEIKEITWGNYRGKGWYFRTFKTKNIVSNALIQIETILQKNEK